jgi:hypothetical protein
MTITIDIHEQADGKIQLKCSGSGFVTAKEQQLSDVIRVKIGEALKDMAMSQTIVKDEVKNIGNG